MQDDTDTPIEDTAPDAAAAEAADTAVAEAPESNEPEEPSEVSLAIAKMGLTRMSLQELKDKSPADLLAFAEIFEIENVNSDVENNKTLFLREIRLPFINVITCSKSDTGPIGRADRT